MTVYSFSVEVNFIKVYLMNIHCRIRRKANKESKANERLPLNVILVFSSGFPFSFFARQ